jgi:AcrR family transcriptional regulator
MSGRRAEAARNDQRVLEAAREVLAMTPDAPLALVARRAGVGIGSLYRRYPSKELVAASGRLQGAVRELLESVQAAGAVRPDVTAEDLALLFRQLRAIRLDDEQRAFTLRRRYLELTLQAFHASGAAPLPGPAPAWKDLRPSGPPVDVPRSSVDA